jgi:hypothetical protein
LFGGGGLGDVAAMRVLVRRGADPHGARGGAVRGDCPVVCRWVGHRRSRRRRALLRQPKPWQADRRSLRIDMAGARLGGAALAILGPHPGPDRAVPGGVREATELEAAPASPKEMPPWVLRACLASAGITVGGTLLCLVVVRTPWVVMLVGWILLCVGGGSVGWLYSHSLRQQSSAE